MAPTVNPGQIVIMSAGHYRNREIQRGDIVVFLAPQDGNPWIKRVVGLPEETIAIKEGIVMIDGQALDEDYVVPENEVTDYSQAMPIRKLANDSYFLLGDNRDNSVDGRIMGTTPRDDIVGKVVFILE
jgi:signal peptidase I